jgi:hypothetical protein
MDEKKVKFFIIPANKKDFDTRLPRPRSGPGPDTGRHICVPYPVKDPASREILSLGLFYGKNYLC